MGSNSEANDVDSSSDDGLLPTLPPERNELDATLAQDSSSHDSSSRESASSQMPKLDGYELLEELGRGGMGVVYRARDEKLDRPVAIKMILAGQFASPESIQRFQLEAETAARLDHPGIVPIYEIGQAGDHRFFSMKLIDGQPLSELLDQYQSDQRKAVHLMVQIAKSVQHAHQRGVLHRDLKPANVLIDGDGSPLLTDLGLAKQMDNDSAITQTGLVLGSPGFMSPEQAAGQTDVTVAADVYAMGAMMYWLVAGRAPITGKSAFEIVRRTIEHEPESIRELRVDADRDLNLICMKALQKSPEKRYGSADEFATELQAWLDGEPLSVKPPTVITWMRRWLRKNFRGVAAGVCMGTLCGLILGFMVLTQIASQQLATASSLHEQLEASNAPWITHGFAWLERVPAWLRNSLPAWSTLIIAMCGAGTIGLSKPSRQESGVAAGLTAALLAGILAFVISWAWQPLANRTREASSQDVQLLSDYLFTHPDDRHLAEDTIFKRYPGLQKANSWERSDLLSAKIDSDQAASIPGAIGMGLVVTTFISFLPMLLSSILASIVWQREQRGLAFFWRSTELAYYASTLMFILCRSFSDFTGAAPAIHLQLITSTMFVVAIIVALRRKRFWWRIPMFIAVLVSTGVNMSDASRVGRAHWEVGPVLHNEEKLVETLPFLQRQVDHTEDRYRRFQLATAYAFSGEDKKYVEQCSQLLSDGNFYRRSVAEQASKAILLKPSLHRDLSKAHTLARWASEQRAFDAWGYLVRALSEQRQGNAQETLHWSEKSRETANAQNTWRKEIVIATAHLLDAMAHKMLGDDENRKNSFAKAEQLYVPDLDASFEAKMTYEMLRSELEDAIKQTD